MEKNEIAIDMPSVCYNYRANLKKSHNKPKAYEIYFANQEQCKKSNYSAIFM